VVVAVTLASACGLVVLALGAFPPGSPARAVFEQRGWEGLLVQMRDLLHFTVIEIVAWHTGAVMLVLTLLVAIRASGCITEERETGTWDAVVLTPISTRQIVHGKFWGVLGAFMPYLIANAVAVLAVSALLGVYGLLCGVFAIAATFIVAAWVAAFGVLCSAHLQSSWRSALVTLAVCFVTINAVSFVSAVLGGCGGAALTVCALLGSLGPGQAAETADAVVMVGFLTTWLLAWGFLGWLIVKGALQRAIERIHSHDRTRIVKGFTRDYINWRIDRHEERQRERIAHQTADPVPLVDDE
jgi:hypothetical protein